MRTIVNNHKLNDYILNTINIEIGRITQIFSEQYLLLNNGIG
jgi:hypothetical protein